MSSFTPPRLPAKRLKALKNQVHLSNEEIQGLVDELHEEDMLTHVGQVMNALPQASEALLSQLEEGGTSQ